MFDSGRAPCVCTGNAGKGTFFSRTAHEQERIVTLLAPARLGVSLLAVTAATGLLALVWRRRGHAAARPLLGVAATMCLGSVLHLVFVELSPGLLAGVGGAGPEDWPLVVFPVTALAGGLWLLFALQYTGRGTVVFRVSAVVVLGLAGTGLSAAALYFAGRLSRGLVTDVLSLVVFVVSLLAAVGVFLLIGVSIGQNAFPSREPLFFAGGAVALMGGVSVAGVFDSTLVYAGLLTVSGVLFGRAAAPTAAFETLPAARVLGRDQVIEEMTDAAVVVDRDGRVRDLNAAAERLFEITRDAAAGDPVEGLLSETTVDIDALTAEGPTRVETADGRILTVRADRIDGRRADTLGYLLVWTDITDQQLRERRLTILNRFLVTTLRQQIEHIRTDAELIADGDPPDTTPRDDATPADADPAQVADRIWTTASSLIRLVADARTLERALEDGRARTGGSTDIDAELRAVVEAVTDDRDSSVAVRVEAPDEPVSIPVSLPIVRALVRNLLGDATAHAASRVTVTVSRPATIAVADDRPLDGDANADHSIAIARMAAEYADATIDVDRTDRGRRIVVTFSMEAPRQPNAPADRIAVPDTDR